MKSQIVVLHVAYDPDEQDPPSDWAWPSLLDVPDSRDVELLASVEATGLPNAQQREGDEGADRDAGP